MLKLLRFSFAHLLLALSLFSVHLCCSATQIIPQKSNLPLTLHIGIPEQESLTLSQGAGLTSLINFTQEFWQIWAIDNKQPIEFIYLAPQKMEQALKNGDIDIIALSFIPPTNQNSSYSIPYIKYKQQLFRRVSADINNGIQIGIHSANYKILDFLPDNISKEYFFNVQGLLTQQTKFDAIYSVQPWLLAEKIQALGIQDKFYTINEEDRAIFFHFITRKKDRALSHLINESLRRVSKLQALAWQSKYFTDIHNKFTLTLGDYLTDLSQQEKEYILDHRELNYPTTEEGDPPYIINNSFSNISMSGFSVDVAQEVTKRTGLIFKPFNRENMTKDLNKNSHINIILQSPKLAISSNHYQLTTPYSDTNYSVITRENMPLYSHFSDLKEKNIGVAQSSTAEILKQQNLTKTVINLYPSVEAALTALNLQEIDYIVADSLTSDYAIKEKALTYAIASITGDNFTPIKLSFATTEKNDLLIGLINKSLQNLPSDTMQSLYSKWGKRHYEQEKMATQTENTTYFMWSIALVIFGTLIFLFHQYKYRTLHHRAMKKALTLAESAKLEAEKSAQAKITFLARMSHEIRTPMNGVLGMAEALTYTDLNKNQTDLLETLNSSATNLLSLLDNVLDFSKMDAGKLTLESMPINLSTLFTGITNSFKHVENEKPLTIRLDVDSTLNENYFIDPTRITQVLNNLISNAIKFTAEGSVVVCLKLVERDKKNDLFYDTLCISVKDTGIGIASKNQGSLFTPFIQADDDITRKFGGTGLGLSICHEIVSAMGSIISLDSELNKGCNFYFNLKLKQANNDLNQEDRRKNIRTLNATNDNRFEHLRILIAEDNLINIQVLSAQLQRLNIIADIAYDGAQALEMHTHQPYDIIISDCHMPHMDGFELAKILSQPKGQLPIWLLAITADALAGAASKCIDAGFDDYMAKPCHQEQITNKLNHAYRELIIKREKHLIEKLKEAPYALFNPHSLFLLNDNDIVLSRNLAEVFSDTWHKEKEHFLAELAQHNFHQIHALAHKQKSVIRYLCGHELENLVIDLEKHAQSKNITKTQKSCLLLIKQLDALHAEINHWLTTLSHHYRFFRLR